MKTNSVFFRAGRIFLAVLLAGLAGCASKWPAPVVERGGATAAAPVSSPDTYVVKAGDTLYSIARDQGMDHRELIAMNGIENPNQISVGRVLKVKPKSNGAATPEVAVTAPVTSDVVVSRPIGDAPVVAEKRPVDAGAEKLKREPKGGKEPYSEHALAMAQGQEQTKPTAAEAAPQTVKPEPKPAEPVAGGGDEVSWVWPASGKVVGAFSESGSKGIDVSGTLGDPVVAVADGKVLVANKFTDSTLRMYGNMVVIRHDNGLVTVYAHNRRLLVKEKQAVTKGQKIAEMGSSDAGTVMLHFEVRNQGKAVDPLKHLPPR